ncbi:MAG: hypothetical protein AMXMBFR13_33210 [Phycisphaerae bacterium]
MKDPLEQLISRRSFLRRGTCATLGLSGLASQLFTTRLVNASLASQSFSDYKALVCIFLFGGNDNGNTLIPYDNGPQNYAFYAATRGALALPQSALNNTIIAPSNTDGRRFALHPALADMKQLFDQGHVAIVSNVGTLVEPATKTQIVAHQVKVPRQLFAHNWQQEQWQVSTADAVEKIGWGGRIADALEAAGANPAANVSMAISIVGSSIFLAGRDVVPYTVSPQGPKTLQSSGLGNSTEQAVVRQAYADLLALQGNPSYAGRHAMQKAFADVTQRAIVSSGVVQNLLTQPTAITTPVPPNNGLAAQLHMVARLIEFAQSDLHHQRQVFFVATGGFDTHDGLLEGQHQVLLTGVNNALKFFWDALGELNMRDQVTTHTASDFGRTYVSNGNGSDHGWGSDHFVMGGSQVAGGKLYGAYPDLTLDGSQDMGSGRYIPSHSVDEYAFELARWLGVPLSEMPMVFPNLTRFLDPQDPATHLGFMAH